MAVRLIRRNSKLNIAAALRTSQQLREASAPGLSRLETVLADTPCQIILTNRDGIVVYASRCRDTHEELLVIQLKKTYYHYCEIDAATVQGLQTASSKRQHFETRIRGSGADGPFDCRTHPIPKKYRQ